MNCPKCGKPNHKNGKVIKCPFCNHLFLAPKSHFLIASLGVGLALVLLAVLFGMRNKLNHKQDDNVVASQIRRSQNLFNVINKNGSAIQINKVTVNGQYEAIGWGNFLPITLEKYSGQTFRCDKLLNQPFLKVEITTDTGTIDCKIEHD